MVFSEKSNSHWQEHFWVLQGQHKHRILDFITSFFYSFLLLLQLLPIDVPIYMYNLAKNSKSL